MRTCPFCQSEHKHFLSGGVKSPLFTSVEVIGAGPRRDVFCPRCRSHDRERLVYLFIKLCTDLFHQRQKILHVAPPRALRKVLERCDLEYTTADLHRHDVALRLDIAHLDLPSSSYHVVLCNHVLEHVEDDRRALSELFRVLRPGGWAILQVPICTSLDQTLEDPTITTHAQRLRVYGQADHVRLYGRDYPARIVQAGFELKQFHWKTENQALFGGEQNLYSLIPEERIFWALKPPEQ